MALNSRSMMDPRMSFAMRATFSGAMLATVKVYSSVPLSNTGTLLWDADNPDPTKNEPKSPYSHTLVYSGQARVQPYHDVRAKVGQDEGQNVVQIAVRVQIDYAGNTLPGKTLAQNWDPIGAGSFVTVTHSFTTADGVPVDSAMASFDYQVEFVNFSSNSAVKGLLCTVIGQDVGGPRGNL